MQCGEVEDVTIYSCVYNGSTYGVCVCCTQDVGTSHICDGLWEQNLEHGLNTLVLWNNQITYQSMPALSRSLVGAHISHHATLPQATPSALCSTAGFNLGQ